MKRDFAMFPFVFFTIDTFLPDEAVMYKNVTLTLKTEADCHRTEHLYRDREIAIEQFLVPAVKLERF